MATALVASQRNWSFAYKAVSGDGNTVLRDLTVERCSVANNNLADKVKRTCQVTLAASSPFDQLSELFRPYVTLTYGGTTFTWCLGTFLLSSNSNRALAEAGGSSSALVGYDRLLVVEEDKIDDRLVILTGAVVTDWVAAVLVGAGLPSNGVVSSALQTVAPMEWDPGTPKAKVIADLLSAIGYRSLYCDELGTPIAEPYVDPAAAPVVWNYAPDVRSVIVPGVDVTLDLFSIPNRWVAYVSEPDRPVLTSTYTNENPASVTSTVNRGRTIVDVIALQQATGEAPPVNQATLDAKVLQMARNASQVYSDAEFTTGLMPFHGDGEVFTLDVGDGPVRYREHTWEMDLAAGGQMKHRFRRVVAI